MTIEKQRQHGRKCTCEHYEKQHAPKLNPVVANTENDQGYLTNGEWWDKYVHTRGFLEDWMPADCRECDCKQYTPIKRKWRFWK